MLEATKRLIQILDTKYKRWISGQTWKINANIWLPQSNLELLPEFEQLFDRTLGDWDFELVSLQLKDGAKQSHGQPFSSIQKHLEPTKRDPKTA